MLLNVFDGVRRGETSVFALYSPDINTNLPRAGQIPAYRDEMTQEMLRDEIDALRAAKETAFSYQRPKIEAQITQYVMGFNGIAMIRGPILDRPQLASDVGRQRPVMRGWGA